MFDLFERKAIVNDAKIKIGENNESTCGLDATAVFVTMNGLLRRFNAARWLPKLLHPVYPDDVSQPDNTHSLHTHH